MEKRWRDWARNCTARLRCCSILVSHVHPPHDFLNFLHLFCTWDAWLSRVARRGRAKERPKERSKASLQRERSWKKRRRTTILRSWICLYKWNDWFFRCRPLIWEGRRYRYSYSILITDSTSWKVHFQQLFMASRDAIEARSPQWNQNDVWDSKRKEKHQLANWNRKAQQNGAYHRAKQPATLPRYWVRFNFQINQSCGRHMVSALMLRYDSATVGFAAAGCATCRAEEAKNPDGGANHVSCPSKPFGAGFMAESLPAQSFYIPQPKSNFWRNNSQGNGVAGDFVLVWFFQVCQVLISSRYKSKGF